MYRYRYRYIGIYGIYMHSKEGFILILLFYLIQTNGTSMWAANSCFYSYLAIQLIDDSVSDADTIFHQKILYFGWYRDDCITIWTRNLDKIELLEFLNSLDKNLEFTVETAGKQTWFSQWYIYI